MYQILVYLAGPGNINKGTVCGQEKNAPGLHLYLNPEDLMFYLILSDTETLSNYMITCISEQVDEFRCIICTCIFKFPFSSCSSILTLKPWYPTQYL